MRPIVALLLLACSAAFAHADTPTFSNPKTSEAIIDFLIPVPNSELMEFNVFKYAPAGSGLVALQFARRVKPGEIDSDEMRQIEPVPSRKWRSTRWLP